MILRYSLKVLLFLITTAFFFSCSKNEDSIPQDIEINNFVWGGMNAYYKWQGDVPDLSDRKFSSQPELNSYLYGFSNPADLFQSLRYQPDVVDKFSWIVDDYIALENAFQGIRKTSGIKALVKPYENGSDSVYVFVRDVVAGSDAELQGVTRGMIFNKINGQYLLQSNYRNLFSNDTYTITLADSFNGGNPIAGTTEITVTKAEIQENPVKIAKVIEQGGKKIGYLLYNQFSTSYDDELNAAFANFKAEGITDLIVDLRYNGGGSVDSAGFLASMITGQFNGELFARQIWNDKIMNNTQINQEQFKNYFTNEVKNRFVTEPLNSVGMTSVYFIVSNNTASASELVINGLKAYLQDGVKLVGTQTVGKQVGSITLYDSDDYSRNGSNLNPRHNWAMQPIVLEITNKDGENNPEGYIPDVIIEENPSNLGVLGEETEPLLARTIQYILTGSRGSSARDNFVTTKSIWDSSMQYQDYQNMYVELK